MKKNGLKDIKRIKDGHKNALNSTAIEDVYSSFDYFPRNRKGINKERKKSSERGHEEEIISFFVS